MLRTPINENSSLPGTFAIEYISKNPNNGYIHTKTKTVFVADSTTYTIDIFDSPKYELIEMSIYQIKNA